MKYGIIFNIEKNDYSLANLKTGEIIESVGDIYKNYFDKERKKNIHDIQATLKKLTCEEYIKKCIQEKTVFKYKYSQYRFIIGGISCSGEWYMNCLDYVDGRVAVSTQYHDITKLPSEVGSIVED